MTGKPVAELLQQKKIFQLINPKLVQGSPDLTAQEAVDEMRENRAGYIVIVRDEKPIGIFTEVDVCHKLLGKNADWSKKVSDYMTCDPMVLNPKDSVGKAIKLMCDHRLYHIPLVDQDQKLTGVISVRTLIRFLAEFYPTEVYNLPPSSDQIVESPEGG